MSFTNKDQEKIQSVTAGLQAALQGIMEGDKELTVPIMAEALAQNAIMYLAMTDTSTAKIVEGIRRGVLYTRKSVEQAQKESGEKS